jgi:hypothetical protein
VLGPPAAPGDRRLGTAGPSGAALPHGARAPAIRAWSATPRRDGRGRTCHGGCHATTPRRSSRPNTIYIPFGADPEEFKIDLDKPTRAKQIALIRGRAGDIDPARPTVRADGRTLAYDYLVVATGADMRPAEIPGLAEHALTVWTPEEMLELRTALGALAEAGRRGTRRRLVPPNNRCSGPLYEMVLMTDTWLRRQDARQPIDITWTTYEESFIQAFGPRLHAGAQGHGQAHGEVTGGPAAGRVGRRTRPAGQPDGVVAATSASDRRVGV